MASFGDRVVGAMKLDPSTFEDIERDPTAISQTVGVIALAAVSAGIGNIWYGGVSGIIFTLITMVIQYAVWAVMVWVIGTKLMPDPATKADLPETFRVIGFAAAPWVLGIVTIVPLIGWLFVFLLWVWSIAVMVVAVKQVLDYTDFGKPIIVVIIAFVVQLLVGMMMAGLFIGSAMIGSRMS